MYGPDAAILLMYESHDTRHAGFRRLTMVNERPRRFESHYLRAMKAVATASIQVNLSLLKDL